MAVRDRRKGIGIATLASLVVAGLIIPSITLAANVSPQRMDDFLETTLNLTAINSSLPNGTLPATFTPAPTPITLLHLILNQTSLPGERYMAFGPSVIEVAVSPILLVFLVGGVGAAAGAWYIFGKKRKDD
jgi:hypothetical protein